MSQYVTVCHSMSQYVTVCHSISQYVTVCQSVLQYVTLHNYVSLYVTVACVTAGRWPLQALSSYHWVYRQQGRRMQVLSALFWPIQLKFDFWLNVCSCLILEYYMTVSNKQWCIPAYLYCLVSGHTATWPLNSAGGWVAPGVGEHGWHQV